MSFKSFARRVAKGASKGVVVASSPAVLMVDPFNQRKKVAKATVAVQRPMLKVIDPFGFQKMALRTVKKGGTAPSLFKRIASNARKAEEIRSRATAHIGPSKGSLTFDPFKAKQVAMAQQASMAQVAPSFATAQSFTPSVPKMPSMDYEAPPVEAQDSQESEEQPMGNKVLLLGGLAVLALLMLKKK